MYEYIETQIKIHCKIYNKNFNEVYYDFTNKKNSSEILNELLNIYNYDEIKLCEDRFLSIFNSIKKTIKNLKNPEKTEIIRLNKIFSNFSNNNFLEWFISFSFNNNLIYEKFSYEKKKELKSLETYEFLNLILNEICLFVDFLYVNELISHNSSSIDSDIIKKIIFRIVMDLKETNVINIKKRTVFNERQKKIKYANLIEFEITTKPKSLFNLYKISFSPSTIKHKKETYLIGFNHYLLNIYLVSEKDTIEKTIITDELVNTIKNHAKTEYYIDKKMMSIINNEIQKKNNNNYEENFKNMKKNYAIKSKIIQNFENNDLNEIEDLKDNLHHLKFKIKNIQKKISTQTDIWIFENFKKDFENEKRPIYFIPYLDFRGRIYYKSMVSPQSKWIFRFLYNYGKCEKFEYVDFNIWDIDNNLLNNIKNSLNIHNVNPKMIAWVLLSIGYKFKNEIEMSDSKININNFVDIGIKKYLEFENNFIDLFNIFDEMDAAETIYYFLIIKDTKENILIKRYLIKDSTASVYQHLTKVLGNKNSKSLNYINMTSKNEWYDTYNPLINYVHVFVDKDIKKYFGRAQLKHIFFKTKYNIQQTSAREDFIDSLDFIKERGIYLKTVKAFSKVFSLLKKGIPEQEILFEDSFEDFNKKILDTLLIKLEDITICLVYFKTRKREICIFHKGARHTIVNYKITKEHDLSQMQISALPNIIHALDALYARRIIKILFELNIKIFTIHDAFAIPFDSCEVLILTAWDCINIEEKLNFIKKTNKGIKINSLTILI